MRVLIGIDDGPLSPASRSGLGFARAALAAGHAIVQVFFYHDGVLHAVSAGAAPGGEPDAGREWADLARAHGLDLVCCVAAARRRGVLDEAQAVEVGRPANVADGFRIAGLGSWMDAVIGADRVVRFGRGQ